MADMDDDIVTLANEALLRLGEAPVGIEDDTEMAGLVQGTAPGIIHAALARQPFPFNTFTLVLARDDAVSFRHGYAHAFRQPGGRLRGPLRVMPADDPYTLLRRYLCENDYLFADAETVAASYIMRPPLGQWPPLFREYMVTRLAQAFCLAITAKLDFAQQFEQAAHGLPSERGRGGAWGTFLSSEVMSGSAPRAFGEGSWLTGARGAPARVQG